MVDHQGLEGNVWGQELREMEGSRTVRLRTHSKSTQNMFLLLLCLLTKNYWSYIIK